jgi:hypothetical protein
MVKQKITIILCFGGGYCTQIEPAAKRLHDEFIEKHGRKPTLEEFMGFEELYCTRIEPITLRCGCPAIMIQGADENFLEFRRYIQNNMEVIEELKKSIEEDLRM